MQTLGNEKSNAFARRAIEDTTIRLLREAELEALSITKITSEARVSRNTFYRNYETKESVIKSRVMQHLDGWNSAYQKTATGSNAELYGSFFAHLKENADFYLLLKERGLFHLFRDAYLDLFGPKPEHNNMWAYTVAFIAGGTLSWIEEWIARGMQESAESMTKLLAEHGMK